MFDLLKDVDKYSGVPPYASELYGVYQPLLGWRSRLTRNWLTALPEPDGRSRRILDARITPGPSSIDPDYLAVPLEPGSGRTPWTVYLVKDLSSQVLAWVRARVQGFVDGHGGRLPDGAEWNQVIEINAFMDQANGPMRAANDFYRDRFIAEELAKVAPAPLDAAALDRVRTRLLDRMRYESQVAAMLLFYAEGQAGLDPDTLDRMFAVREALPLDSLLVPDDPLATIDPASDGGALSAVGLVHIFRQYFFDLGTFLGEPVEHVWLSPGSTIELIEVSVRRQLIERTTETTTESAVRSEVAAASKEEISQAMRAENESSTKFGVSSTNTVNYGVYQGTVAASFGVDSTRKSSRESTHKSLREQSEKVATELKQSVKSVFRSVTETTDTTSRRHTISNPTDKLINYELRRKMRRVGVQLQDIGTRLCWQVFIDDPGAVLGLGSLVDFADASGVASVKEPDKLPAPAAVTKKVTVPLVFKPILDYSNNRAQYEFEGPGGDNVGHQLLAHIRGDEDDDDSQIIAEYRGIKVDPPQTGYELTHDIRVVGVQGDKMLAIQRFDNITPAGSFDLIVQRVNFGGENVVNIDLELVFAPTATEAKRIEDANAEATKKYDAERTRAARKAYEDAIVQRIDDASRLAVRPPWDLRDEERTVIYRKLIERLMLDSWKAPDDAQRRRVAHVRSEVVRSIFDVDAMMYFVAPEWWMPRRRSGHLTTGMALDGVPVQLRDDDVTLWGGAAERRPDNYLVTPTSSPARLGSSLGWLLQLDGDNLRNAFLNAPWVKAVVPIRPGHEQAALHWLRAIESADEDGWDTPYLGNEPQYQGKTIGEVLEDLAADLQTSNTDITSTLQADRVFEHGFDHLAGGFDAGLSPNEVFSQWISIVPTDQIVAAEYTPQDLTDQP